MSGKLDFNVSFKTEQAAREFQTLFTEYVNGSKKAGDMANQMLGGKVEKLVQVRLAKAPGGGQELEAITKSVRSEVDKLTASYQKANKVQADSLTSVRQQLNKAKQDRDAIAAFGSSAKVSGGGIFGQVPTKDFTLAQQKVSDLTQQIRLLEAASGNAFDRFAAGIDLGGVLKAGRGLTDIVAIFQSIGIVAGQLVAPITAASKALADLQGFALSFEAIGAGASGANQALSESRRIALGLGSSITTTREGFQKLAPVILSSGGNLGDVSSVVESLSSRFAAFGLNADQSRRVLNGVIQAFAKGKLQAEELTQQISEADPAFKIDLAKAAQTAGLAVNGTTAELEALVKAGKITSQELIRLIPLISKSELLFGKLGSSGASAIAALEAGNVTITQVQANLGSLNQLNLEKFAKLAEPLVILFLRAQASVTDFITRIIELEGTKSLVGIFNQIGGSVVNLAETVLSGIEAFAKAIGPILQFINALLSIPGAAELAGLALLGKLAAPFRSSQDVFSKGLAGFILRPLRDVQNKASGIELKGLFAGKTFDQLDDFEKRVLSIGQTTDQLKQNLNSKIKAGLFGGIKSSAESASAGLTGLAAQAASTADAVIASDARATKAQSGNQKKLIASYRRVFNQRQDLISKQGALQSQIASLPPSFGPSKYDRQLAKIESRIPALDSQLGNLRKSLKSSFGIKVDDAALDNSIKNLRERQRILRDDLRLQQSAQASGRAANKSALDDTIKTQQAALRDLRKSLRGAYAAKVDTSALDAQTKSYSGLGREVRTVQQISNRYFRQAITDEINSKVATDATIKSLKERQQVLRETLRLNKSAQSSGKAENKSALAGTIKAQGEQLKSLEKQERDRVAQIAASAKEGSRYTEGLTAQSSAAERAAAGIKQLSDENKALKNSTKLAQDGVVSLNKDLRTVRGQIKKLGDPDNVFRSLDPQQQKEDRQALQKALATERDLLERRQLAGQQILANADAVDANTNAIRDYTAAQEKASASTSRFGGIVSAGLGGSLKAGRGLLGLLGKGIVTLASELGVLGIAFLAIGAAQSAYNKVTEQSRAIQEESKIKVKELTSALQELKGGSVEAQKPATGLALVWERFGFLIKGIADAGSGLFGSISSGLAKFSGDTKAAEKKWYDFAGAFAATVLGFAGTGAAIGAGLGALGGPFAAVTATGGAVVGTIVGIGVAIAGLGSGSEVAQKKFKDAIDATNESTAEQGRAVSLLTGELKRQVAEQQKLIAAKKAAEDDKGGGKGKSAATFTPQQQQQLDGLAPKVQAGYTAALAGVRALDQKQQALNNQLAQYTAELTKAPPKVKTQLAELGALLRKEQQLVATRKKEGSAPKGSSTQNELNKTRGQIQQLRASLESTSEGASALDAVTNKTKQLEGAAAKARKEFNTQKAALDAVAASSGNLSFEQSKAANTLTNLDEKLKDARAGLQSIDPALQPEKWNQQSKSVAEASVKYEELGNKAAALQALYSAAALVQGINLGTFTNSVSNAELVVKKLEEARIGIDINSPELEVVTRNLIAAQQRVDQLNGKKATVYVQLFQQGARDDIIPPTLNNIKRLIEGIQGQQATIDVRTAGADIVATQIESLERLAQYGAQTTSNLKIQLIEKQLSKMDAVRAAEDRNSQQALRNIDAQQRKIDKYYDSQISKLQELGPAQKELAQLERSRLIEDTKKPGEEGLRARAQLERELAQEQIANIEKQKRADQERLQAQRELIQLEQQQREDARIPLENQLSALVAQRTDAEIADISRILQGRSAETAQIQAGNQALQQRSTIDVGGKPMDLNALLPQENIIRVGNLERKIGTVNTAIQNTTSSANDLSSALNSGLGGSQVGQLDTQIQGTNAKLQGLISSIGSISTAFSAGLGAPELGSVLSAVNQQLQATVNTIGQLNTVAGGGIGTLVPQENVTNASQLQEKLSGTNEQLKNATVSANELKEALLAIKNLGSITVNIGQSRARWAGGPVSSGLMYKVNELGQEGFLSRSGDFSMINKPQNAMWRAPSSGIVIPANVISQMTIPQANVKPRVKSVNPASSGQDRFVNKLTRYIGAIAAGKSNGDLGQLANVQAQQAVQIGKLSRAVQDLTEKDWNVNVKLRSSGGGAAILEALNHRL
jgi:tape measure domain-containing protein